MFITYLLNSSITTPTIAAVLALSAPVLMAFSLRFSAGAAGSVSIFDTGAPTLKGRGGAAVPNLYSESPVPTI